MSDNPIFTLAARSRSCRRFDASRPISRETLLSLIECARMAPTGANRQPLRFYPITDSAVKETLFPQLHWAMALPDWAGPEAEERPTAYIVILADTRLAPAERVSIDVGIAAQTIALAAAAEHLGLCMLGAFKKEDVHTLLQLPEHLLPVLILALGYPAETPVLCDVPENGDVRYFRTPDGIHHVPKRSLQALLYEPEKPAL